MRRTHQWLKRRFVLWDVVPTDIHPKVAKQSAETMKQAEWLASQVLYSIAQGRATLFVT